MSNLKYFPRTYLPPACPTCKAKLLRWSWWEHRDEYQVYWYCLECDKAERAPYIFVFDKTELIMVRDATVRAKGSLYTYQFVYKWLGGKGFQPYTTLRAFLKGEGIKYAQHS